MNKVHKDIGNKWIRKNYKERLKCAQDKDHESSMQIDEFVKNVNSLEEHAAKELEKKTNVLSGKEKNSTVEKNRCKDKKCSQSSCEQNKRND